MKTCDFWRLVDKTRQVSGGNTKVQAKLLILELAAQGPEAVLKFEEHFYRFVRQAFERWRAPESALGRYGGFGDDGMKYFVKAIIAAGEETYYKFLGAPHPFEIKDIYDKCGCGGEITWVPPTPFTGQPDSLILTLKIGTTRRTLNISSSARRMCPPISSRSRSRYGD